MSQGSIIEKLQGELSLPLRRESQVVYLMAEVRKYLEYEMEKEIFEFSELRFFCNWALHTKIDHQRNAPRIRAFLKPFDMTPGMSIEQYLSSDFYQKIMQLEPLRIELQRFLKKHLLRDSVVAEHQGWSRFLYLYTSVISEVPLEYAKGDLLPDEVLKVEVHRLPAATPSTPQKMTSWTITLKNGKFFSSTTLYGTIRDESNRVVRLPDFWEGLDGFQL